MPFPMAARHRAHAHRRRTRGVCAGRRPPPPTPPARPPANFPPPAVAGGPPGVAAVVNGQKIPRTEVAHLRARHPAAPASRRCSRSSPTRWWTRRPRRKACRRRPPRWTPRSPRSASSLATPAPQSDSGGVPQVPAPDPGRCQGQSARPAGSREAGDDKGQKPIHRAHIHYIVILTANPGGDPTKKPHTDAEAQAIIAKAQADLKAGQSRSRPSPASTRRTAARATAATSASSARTASSTRRSSRRRWRSSRAR